MDSKAKWQLDFEVELSLLSNEDLLVSYVEWSKIASENALSRRMSKYHKLINEEVLHRMSYWTLNGGYFDPMWN